MANSDKYNIRFYRSDQREVNEADYLLIKDYLFNKQRYTNKSPISEHTPLIFEILPDQSAVELQIEPYKNYEFWLRFDDLLDEIGQKFDIWQRKMLEAEPIDTIIRYGQESGRFCWYQADEVIIEFSRKEMLPNLPYELLKPNQATFSLTSQYKSCMEVGNAYPVKTVTYSLNNKINLENKFDIEKGVIGSTWIDDHHFSNKSIKTFINSLSEETDKLILKYKGRTVRSYFYNTTEKEFQCYIFDDWDNCADEEFLNYLHKRTITQHM